MHPDPSAFLQAMACWWVSQGYCECMVLYHGWQQSHHVCEPPESHHHQHYKEKNTPSLSTVRVFISTVCIDREAIKDIVFRNVIVVFYKGKHDKHIQICFTFNTADGITQHAPCPIYLFGRRVENVTWCYSRLTFIAVETYTKTNSVTLWFQPHHHQSMSRSVWPR